MRLFQRRDQAHHVEELGIVLGSPVSEVSLMCRKLRLVDILTEDPPGSQRFRYNLGCANIELQAGLESSLVEPDASPVA
jgi:hypothetical protein